MKHGHLLVIPVTLTSWGGEGLFGLDLVLIVTPPNPNPDPDPRSSADRYPDPDPDPGGYSNPDCDHAPDPYPPAGGFPKPSKTAAAWSEKRAEILGGRCDGVVCAVRDGCDGEGDWDVMELSWGCYEAVTGLFVAGPAC